MIIQIVGIVLALVFIAIGTLIHRYQYYNLIPSYNFASAATKKQYDIEGLAAHIGNGLVTLGILLLCCVALFYFQFDILLAIFIGLLISIALIILIGTRKFMPARMNLMKRSPIDAKHYFLYWLLSEKAYKSIEMKTRKWIQVCQTCDHKQDFWEAGGVRGGGCGEPLKLQWCENCQKARMHKIRKKMTFEA